MPTEPKDTGPVGEQAVGHTRIEPTGAALGLTGIASDRSSSCRIPSVLFDLKVKLAIAPNTVLSAAPTG